MIGFHAKVSIAVNDPAGADVTVEHTLDRSHRCDEFGPGTVLHDGRVHRWMDNPADWNGSFLAWSRSTPDNGPGLTLYTDRLGSIPVYLAVTMQSICIASNLRDLCLDGFTQPDPVALRQVLLLGMPFGRRSLLEDVELLPPASRIVCDGVTGKVSIDRYWTPPMPVESAPPSGSIERMTDELIDRLRSAHAHIPQAEHTAYPVTAGLDSRINLALAGERAAGATLFHCAGASDPETPIARRVAATVGGVLLIVDPAQALTEILDADPFAETGELSSWQWWLSGVPQALAADSPAPMLVDGYFQDVLFNPHLINPHTELPPDDRYSRQAAYRWKVLLRDRHAQPPSELVHALQQACAESGGGSRLDTEQRFYFENRSRRYVMGTVRLAQNHLPVALPGLDHELVDYGLSLPWSWRVGGPLYRRAIIKLAPKLADLPEGKSGLPLTSDRRWSLRRALRRRFERGIARHLLPRSLVSAGGFARLLGHSPEFQASVGRAVRSSSWLDALSPGAECIADLLDQRRLSPADEHLICNALTIVRLERASNSLAERMGG